MLGHVKMTPERLRSDFEQGYFECLLVGPASGAGAAVGFALFFHTYSTFEGRSLYLEDLYVNPSARGQGIGRALLRGIAAVALDRNCARLQWQALSWNTAAIDFYKSDAVRARERVETDGTRWLNFIMKKNEIEALARGMPREAVGTVEADVNGQPTPTNIA